VRRRLLRLGYPGGLVARAIDRLTALGYLDDVAFARAWVESRDRAHPRGALVLRRELVLRGVARETIDEALAGREAAVPRSPAGPGGEADERAAVALLERRRRGLEREPDPRRRRQRAYALLARSGFDPETCRTVAAVFFTPGDDVPVDEDPVTSISPDGQVRSAAAPCAASARRVGTRA